MKTAYTVGRFQPPTIGHGALIRKVIEEAGDGGEAYVFVSSVVDKATNPLTVKQKLPILEKMFPDVHFIDTSECKPAPGAKEDMPCGGPLNALEWLKRRGKANITLVAGLDREDDFGPGARIWTADKTPNGFEFLGATPRTKTIDKPGDLSENNMSGTKARTLVELGKKPEFYAAVGYTGQEGVDEVEAIYNTIHDWIPESKQYLADLAEKRRKRAEKPPKARGGGGDDEGDDDLRSPDVEYTPIYPAKAGRRRTHRRRRTRRTKRNKASSTA